jgi:hypothetical protein
VLATYLSRLRDQHDLLRRDALAAVDRTRKNQAVHSCSSGALPGVRIHHRARHRCRLRRPMQRMRPCASTPKGCRRVATGGGRPPRATGTRGRVRTHQLPPRMGRRKSPIARSHMQRASFAPAGASNAPQFFHGFRCASPVATFHRPAGAKPPEERKMDEHNNEQGRAIGNTGKDCGRGCEEALKDGRLKTIP